MLPLPKRISFVASFLLLISCNGTKPNLVQTETKQTDSTTQIPSWIEMMKDPKVNYYQAVEAFNTYWATREKPTEENGEGRDIFGKEKPETTSTNGKSLQYVYEYKQFLNWMERNKNLVKPNGTLMSPEEIIEQSEKERKNR